MWVILGWNNSTLPQFASLLIVFKNKINPKWFYKLGFLETNSDITTDNFPLFKLPSASSLSIFTLKIHSHSSKPLAGHPWNSSWDPCRGLIFGSFTSITSLIHGDEMWRGNVNMRSCQGLFVFQSFLKLFSIYFENEILTYKYSAYFCSLIVNMDSGTKILFLC